MKPSTQRLIIILGSFALMIASIYVLVSLLIPSYQGVQSLRLQRAQAVNLYENQVEASNKIGGLINQYNSLATVQEALSVILPTEPQTSILMNDVQALAANNSVVLNSISFQYPPIAKAPSSIVLGLGTIRITANLTGSYESFKAFLRDIETNIRVIDVNSLRIDGGGVSKQTNLTYNLIMDAYYQSK